MNVSRIGENLVSNTLNANGADDNKPAPDDLLGNLIHNVTTGIANGINDIANDLTQSLAAHFGLEDFYSAHMLDYCEGFFVPGPVPNATLSASSIHKNVTACGNHTSMFTFDPRAALEQSIAANNLTGLNPNDTLSKLAFPDELEMNVRTFHTAWKVMFVMYCTAIALAFLAVFASAAGLFIDEHSGRGLLGGLLIPSVAAMLFTCLVADLLIASAISTVLQTNIVSYINTNGDGKGISATVGGQFMALTWATTAVAFAGSVAWCVGAVLPLRARRRARNRPVIIKMG